MTAAPAGAPRRAGLREAAVVFCAALLLDALLTCPVVFWGDSAQLARRAASLELSPAARGYPLHRVLAWTAAGVTGSPALGANAVSAVCAAVAAALAYATGLRVSGSRAGGVAAAAALALCPSFCLFAGVAEVYTLHSAILLGVLLAALGAADSARARWSVGLLLGLSFLNHRMSLLAVPGLALLCGAELLRRRADGRTARRLVDLGASFAIGVLPFAALCAFASRRPPDGASSPVWWWLEDVFLGGERNAAGLLGEGVRSTGENAAYVAKWIAYQLPGPALALAGWGLLRLRRSRAAVGWAFAALLLPHVVFPLRLDWAGDRFAFLIPFSTLAAVLVAEGVAGVEARWGGRAARAAVVATGAAPVCVALALASTPLGARVLPGVTDEARRLLVLPVRIAYDAPPRICRERLELLPRGARLHCDWGDGQVYLYLQEVEGVRRDVAVDIWSAGRIRLRGGGAEEWIAAMPGGRSVPRAVQALSAADRGALEEKGEGLWRVNGAR